MRNHWTFTHLQWGGLAAGPLLALLTYLGLPSGIAGPTGDWIALTEAGRATAAIATWMAIWWLTEAVEVPVTALLPLILFPLFSVSSMREAAAPYAHDMIFLFLGGFVLALSMQRWHLDHRVARWAVTLVGNQPQRVIGGLMLTTAVMSMWISNTATVAVMLPIALSLVDRMRIATEFDDDPGRYRTFATALLLGVAYSASIGGIGTLIGTPPNLFLASFLREHTGLNIGFAAWMALGLPVVACLLPFTWWFLVHVAFNINNAPVPGLIVTSETDRDPQLSRGERIVLVVFILTATAWMLRPLLTKIAIAGRQPLAGLTDTGIALIAAMILFLTPVDAKRRIFVMDWASAAKLPWGVLLLFGGGLSLASAVEANGVADFIAATFVGLDQAPLLVLIAGVALLVVFLTEMTSNTATAVTFIPVLAAVAAALNVHPLMLTVPAALTASLAFMMPVATPPNAIVFGSGMLTIPQMARVGLWLNLVSALVATAAAGWLVPLLIGWGIWPG